MGGGGEDDCMAQGGCADKINVKAVVIPLPSGCFPLRSFDFARIFGQVEKFCLKSRMGRNGVYIVLSQMARLDRWLVGENNGGSHRGSAVRPPRSAQRAPSPTSLGYWASGSNVRG